MFKTFHQYLQTHEGEFPLTPRSSCCLLPLAIFMTTPEVIIYGGVIIAIATTGLGVMLVVRKNLNSTHQIPQIIMLESNLFQEYLENLERSLFLSLSETDKEESFYRDIALQTNQSISLVKEEVFFNNLKIVNFIFGNDRAWFKKDKPSLEKLKLLLKYWQTLNQLFSEILPLISPKLSQSIKRYVQAFIKAINELDEYHQFKKQFIHLVDHNYNFSEPKQENLVIHHFVTEEILLNCYQISNNIDNLKEPSQYIWQNYNDDEHIELLAQFMIIFREDLEEEINLTEEGSKKEFLKRLLLVKQTDDLIFINSEDQIEQFKTTQQIVSEQEEQIKIREQFKPPFPPKDNRTSEEIGEQISSKVSNVAISENHLNYSPNAIKKRLIERFNNKPKKQGLSWEEERKIYDVISENIEESLNQEYTPEEIAALDRIQKRLETE